MHYELCINDKKYGNIQSNHKRNNVQRRLSHRAGNERRDQYHLFCIRDVRSDSSAGATGLPRQIWRRPQSHELPPRRLPQSRKNEITRIELKIIYLQLYARKRITCRE